MAPVLTTCLVCAQDFDSLGYQLEPDAPRWLKQLLVPKIRASTVKPKVAELNSGGGQAREAWRPGCNPSSTVNGVTLCASCFSSLASVSSDAKESRCGLLIPLLSFIFKGIWEVTVFSNVRSVLSCCMPKRHPQALAKRSDRVLAIRRDLGDHLIQTPSYSESKGDSRLISCQTPGAERPTGPPGSEHLVKIT